MRFAESNLAKHKEVFLSLYVHRTSHRTPVETDKTPPTLPRRNFVVTLLLMPYRYCSTPPKWARWFCPISKNIRHSTDALLSHNLLGFSCVSTCLVNQLRWLAWLKIGTSILKMRRWNGKTVNVTGYLIQMPYHTTMCTCSPGYLQERGRALVRR